MHVDADEHEQEWNNDHEWDMDELIYQDLWEVNQHEQVPPSEDRIDPNSDPGAEGTGIIYVEDEERTHESEVEDDNRDVAFTPPGKRRRIYTLVKWAPTTLRAMKRQLGSERERAEVQRQRRATDEPGVT